MTTNIQPLHDRIIVKRIDEGEQARGGIIIPDSAKEKSQEGEVIAAGLGKYREDGSRQPLDVNAGDRVLFGKYGQVGSGITQTESLHDTFKLEKRQRLWQSK